MAKPAEPEDLLFRFRGAYQKADGYVDITARGVAWSGVEKRVFVAYGDLVKHETSPKSHPKAMLKLTSSAQKKAVVLSVLEATRERAYDVLCDAKVTIGVALKRQWRSAPAAATKAAEHALRAAALEADAALRAEHRDLVGGGVVDERDFWANRPAPRRPPRRATSSSSTRRRATGRGASPRS